jgi:hypothetical protein
MYGRTDNLVWNSKKYYNALLIIKIFIVKTDDILSDDIKNNKYANVN